MAAKLMYPLQNTTVTCVNEQDEVKSCSGQVQLMLIHIFRSILWQIRDCKNVTNSSSKQYCSRV